MLKPVAEVFEVLAKPFLPEEIEWRIGRKTKDGSKGTALAYMNARAVAKRLDEAVGPENWSVDYSPIDMGVSSRLDKSGNATDYKGFIATIELKCVDEEGDMLYVSRSDGANLTDFESIKGGLSGAFKRAASQLGVGRYLYDLKEEWLPLDSWGRFVNEPQLPTWALPEGYVYPEKTPSMYNYTETEEINPFVDNAIPPSNDDIVIPVGKNKGKLVSECDTGYLKWVVNTSNFNEVVKAKAREVLGAF